MNAAFNLVSTQITALRYRFPVENDQVPHCQDNHRVVVDAIRNLDPRRAQPILHCHIQSMRDAYLIAFRNRTMVDAWLWSGGAI